MINTQNIAELSEKVAALEAAIKNAGIELPEVTGADNGKTLQVIEGAWATGAIIPDAVMANPTGEITNNLTALQIGSTKYNIREDLPFSESEEVVGKWINNKPLYRKTISCGALPNNTLLEVNHGISNLNNVIAVNAIAERMSDKNTIILPFVNIANSMAYISLNATKISITTNVDLSPYDNTYVTIYYTKTTD